MSGNTSYYATYTYYVLIIPNVINSNTINITVTPLVTAFSVSAATANVNSPVTVSLTSTYTSSHTYTWNFDGGTGTTAGTQKYNVAWSTAGVKTISLIESTTGGCTDTTYQQVTVGALNVTSGNYAFSQTITLNSSTTGISSTLYSFPALVYIKENGLKTGLTVPTMCNTLPETGRLPLAPARQITTSPSP